MIALSQLSLDFLKQSFKFVHHLIEINTITIVTSITTSIKNLKKELCLVHKTQYEHRNQTMPCSHCKLSGHNKRTCSLLKFEKKHAACVIQGYWRQNQSREVEETENLVCPISYDEIGSDTAKTQGGHVFHTACLLRASQENGNCPMCRTELVPPSEKRFTRSDMFEAEHDGTRQGFHDAEIIFNQEIEELTTRLNLSEARRKAENLQCAVRCQELKEQLDEGRQANIQCAVRCQELKEQLNELREDRNNWKVAEHKAADMACAVRRHMVKLFTEVGVHGEENEVILLSRSHKHESITPGILDASIQAFKMDEKFHTFDVSRTAMVKSIWPPRPDRSWEQWKRSWPETRTKKHTI